jgi:prophage regulatory protein
VHHLVGLAEVAAMLGISRQRAGQVAKEYADFPAPVAALASGRVWERADVEAWARLHPARKPGRPSRSSGLYVPMEDQGAPRAATPRARPSRQQEDQ